MKYAVTMSCTNAFTPGIETKTVANLIETAVLPTFEALSKWEREKRVYGGAVSGRREISFYIEAASNEEVSDIVRQLPLWAYVETEIQPLESFEYRFNHDKKFLQEVKKHY